MVSDQARPERRKAAAASGADERLRAQAGQTGHARPVSPRALWIASPWTSSFPSPLAVSSRPKEWAAGSAGIPPSCAVSRLAVRLHDRGAVVPEAGGSLPGPGTAPVADRVAASGPQHPEEVLQRASPSHSGLANSMAFPNSSFLATVSPLWDRPSTVHLSPPERAGGRPAPHRLVPAIASCG